MSCANELDLIPLPDEAQRRAWLNFLRIISWGKMVCEQIEELEEAIAALGAPIGGDHGALAGLLDDDHPQYALTDGSRGNFDAAGAAAAVAAIAVLDGDAAGGQLGGTYPNPDVRGLRETAGPTLLTMGAVADGQVLTRSGANIVGTAPGAATWTTIERDFGSTATWTGTFTITDAGISGTTKIIIQQAPGPYTGKGTRADEAECDRIECIAYPGTGTATVRWRAVSGYRHAQTVLEGGDNKTGTATPYQETLRTGALQVVGRVKGNFKFIYTLAA